MVNLFYRVGMQSTYSWALTNRALKEFLVMTMTVVWKISLCLQISRIYRFGSSIGNVGTKLFFFFLWTNVFWFLQQSIVNCCRNQNRWLFNNSRRVSQTTGFSRARWNWKFNKCSIWVTNKNNCFSKLGVLIVV